MMKKLWFIPVLLASAALSGCASGLGPSVQANQDGLPSSQEVQQPVQETQQSDKAETEKNAVISLVENFGKTLQLVSLLAPEDVVRESIKEHYAEFVTPELLEAWQNDPQQAPGRLGSSPWPDRIEILEVEKLSDDAYQVKGEIIEITSVELQQGGVAAKRPITLEVRKTGDRWLIHAVELGEYADAQAPQPIEVEE